MNSHKPYGFYEKFMKRAVDVICALLAFLVFGWLYLIIALLVRVKLGKPVVFRQKRPGKDGEIFTLYKFRSMTDEKDENGELLPDEVRLTKFGKLLRKTSLDELPEALNILKGDMSIVGPRPLAVRYLSYYSEQESHRHDVLPGLTGYAQVNGRNSLSWEEKFKLDNEYVKKITFIGDVKIVFKTVIKTVKRENIGTSGVDMPMDFDVYRKLQLEEKYDTTRSTCNTTAD